MSATGRFKRYFLRGLAVLLPTILTIWILVWGYSFIQDRISIHINRGLVWLISYVQGPDAALDKDALTKIFVDGTAGSMVGFLIALLLVVVIGALLASWAGKAIWRAIESFIMSTPLLRRVYPYVKQLTDFVLPEEDQKKMFSRVVAVEFPRKGCWALGFVTGSGFREVTEKARREFLTVMVSTTPTPVTGPVIVVPKEETIGLDMTIEEAIRFIVSGGVVSPGYAQPAHVSKVGKEMPDVTGAVQIPENVS